MLTRGACAVVLGAAGFSSLKVSADLPRAPCILFYWFLRLQISVYITQPKIAKLSADTRGFFDAAAARGMTLFLNIVGHFAAFMAAAIAIGGNTWNPRAKKVLRKLTRTGWVAAGIALVGFGVSLATSIRGYLEDRERHAAAVAEISGVWSAMTYPFGLMVWSMEGEQPQPGLPTIDRMLKPGALEEFDKLDLRGDAPHHHGLWSSNLCGATKRGFEQLRQMQSIYVGVIEPALITRMKNVATAYAPRALQTLAPCGEFKPDAAYPWHLHAVTNMEEFRSYLNALRDLRLALDDAT